MDENTKAILDLTANSLQEASFQFQLLEEAHLLSCFLAKACPNPNLAIVGISEIFINAIEHGNLKISFTEKTRLLKAGIWMEEVNKRALLPENKNKYVIVKFKREIDCIKITVKDSGGGFDWYKYGKIADVQTSIRHGRGIAVASSIAFKTLRYLGNGNEVECTISLQTL